MDARLARLAEAPERAAVLLDVDGVLAPIVEHPPDARVPDATRRELRRLAGRYRLVACVSGRTGAEAERIVGVEGLAYVGSHGLELEPEAERWRGRLQSFARSLEWPVEDKGITVSLHYRGHPDVAAAEAALRAIAERAGSVGLVPRFGRKVLELRPPVRADKGTAVRRLLARPGLDRALYAGDDTTDLDAFRGLEEAGLELALRIAVSSPEAPCDLLAAADLIVSGPEGMLELLELL